MAQPPTAAHSSDPAPLQAALDAALGAARWEEALDLCGKLERHPSTSRMLHPSESWRNSASTRHESTYYQHYAATHLALLLYTEQLCEAKFLVKRSKEQADVSSLTPFNACWEAGKALWTNDHAAFFKTVDETQWGEREAPVMKAVRERIVSRRLRLLAASYKTVSLQKVCALLGTKTVPEAVEICRKAGWVVDGSFLKPQDGEVAKQRPEIRQDLLKQITATVLTLESKFQPFVDGEAKAV